MTNCNRVLSPKVSAERFGDNPRRRRRDIDGGGVGFIAVLCRDVDVFDFALRSGNWQTVFTHSLKMEFNGFPDLRLSLLNSVAGRNTAREVRNVRGVVAVHLFNNDCISQ